MELEKEVKKITLGHETGSGAQCLKCKDKCEGFELHFWRKICRNCKCGLEDHDVQTTTEDDKKIGKLLEDTKYTSLIAKLKTDGVHHYKRNVVTLTNSVAAKKDVAIKAVTYEWTPPVPNQSLAVRYIELLPKEKQPVAGTVGAVYRKKQMAKQLPEHDQDPTKCHELSPNEVKQMQQFVKKYKEEALGVGDIKVPEEMEVQNKEKGASEAGDRGTTAVVGALGNKTAPSKGAAYEDTEGKQTKAQTDGQKGGPRFDK
ncbi:Testin [Acipenser ruthenus]|uniref:Testin n=1 Tax=Acipenser ruthenus TaxID=7906 RepID=A0A662YRL4_ACIRT|nr:Testin [Acipenser ruthenus]